MPQIGEVVEEEQEDLNRKMNRSLRKKNKPQSNDYVHLIID